ncbi:hypothetical protein Tco_1159636, partial [Tanacetum coccineum]
MVCLLRSGLTLRGGLLTSQRFDTSCGLPFCGGFLSRGGLFNFVVVCYLMVVLSKEDLKGARIEHGFKRAFMSLFGQDNDTFTSMMLLNVDNYKNNLTKINFKMDPWQPFGRSIHIKQLRETLLQHISNVKTSVAERTRHKRLYDRRVNKRQMQKQESKVGLDDYDADIRPIYDEELMAEVQLIVECNISAIGQQHTEQPEIINE